MQEYKKIIMGVVAFVPLVLGLGVSALTRMDKTWYAALRKPAWTPPSWMFGPVWTVLYLLMGFAAQRVTRVSGAWGFPMLLFWTQLILNLAWTPVFFGQQNPTKALILMRWLLAFTMATTVAFWSVDHVAGALLVPYVAWLVVAWNLNASIIASNVS